MRYTIPPFLLLIPLLLFTVTVHAQSSVEVLGGLNIASRNFQGPTNDQKPAYNHLKIYGLNAGILYEYRFGEYFALSGGLMTNTRGFAYNTTITYISPSTDTTYHFRMQRKLLYLDLPVYVKIYYNIGANANLVGAIGPFVGASVSGRFDYFAGSVTATEFNVYTERVRVKSENLPKPRWEVGVNVRGGIEIRQFSINATYSMGFINYAQYYGNLVMDNVKIRSWAVFLSLGYRFQFKK